MKTTIIPLIGDPVENLYQLGLKEKEAFLNLEKRATKLLSTSLILRYGQDFVSKARVYLRMKEDSFFDECIKSYAEGLGIDPKRYHSFLSLFELAAHYGQVYPELKGMLPGCTSVFAKTNGEYTHTRMMDFPLVGIFEQAPRLYYWKPTDRPAILNYSCEGLAPLFFQGIHGSGMSFALHHKPGENYYREGQSIFEIAFETFFDSQDFNDLKKEIKKKNSITKWSYLVMEKSGQVMCVDIDGPAQNTEFYNVNDTSPLIFTNIPLQQDTKGFDNFLKFNQDRQNWLREKLKQARPGHILDHATNIEDQKIKNWIHPAATLSTVGAYHVNLSTGHIDLKEGDSVLTSSDAIIRFDLSEKNPPEILKESTPLKPFERAWKKAAKAQSYFDQGDFAEAYHELQMAIALVPHPVWKQIMSFYLYLWDFKFVSNNKEMALIYKKVKSLEVPESLKDQWVLFVMRLEKRLELAPTVNQKDVSVPMEELFLQEKLASKPVFATWMKLLYPRMEILEVFSPHRK